MRHFNKEKFKDEAEWLRLRTTGIGGSDIAAILKLNPYKNPLEVYNEKVEGLNLIIENEKMRFGRLLEPVIAKEFSSRYGLKIQKPNYLLRSVKYPFLIASIDYFVYEGKTKGVLEIKTTNSYSYKRWELGIPIYYYLQLQHYLLVSGCSFGYIAVLINGQQLERLRFERDEETIKDIIRVSTEFWNNHIIPRIPPPIEFNEIITPEGEMEADTNILELYSKIIELEVSKDEIEGKIELLKSQLKELIKNKETITRNGEVIITNKVIERNSFDSKKFQSEHPELYNQYLKSIKFNQLKIIKE